MKTKYITYGYFVITLVASLWIQWGGRTVLEFLGATLLTFLFFCGIYFCLKGISQAKISIKILRGLGIIVCLALLWIACAIASMLQFNSFACKTNLIGQNIFTKNTQTYCNFVPWYAKQVQVSNSNTLPINSTTTESTLGVNSEFKITAPTKGVIWKVGGTYEISWAGVDTHEANKNGYSIYLFKVSQEILDRPSGTGIVSIISVDQVPTSRRSFSWTVPASLTPGTDYYISMSPSENGKSGQFTIVK